MVLEDLLETNTMIRADETVGKDAKSLEMQERVKVGRI